MAEDSCFVNIAVTRKQSRPNDVPSTLQAEIVVETSESVTIPTTVTTKAAPKVQVLNQGPFKPLLQFELSSNRSDQKRDRLFVSVSKRETDIGVDHQFQVGTNIPTGTRGVSWRNIINYLRAQFSFVSQDAGMSGPLTDWMNPYLIQEFLKTFYRPRRTTWTPSIPLALVRGIAAFDDSTFLECPETPLTFTVDISIPDDYSTLDFVDAAITLSNDFSSQASLPDRQSDADLAFFFIWIAVNASHSDHVLENRLWVIHEFAVSLTSRYRSSRHAMDFREGVKLLRAAIESCDSTVTHVCRDILIFDLVVLLCEVISATESSTEELEEATQWCSENIITHLPHGAAGINNFAQLYIKRYEQFGDLEDLNKNITILQTAIDSFPPDNPERALTLFNITRSLRLRYTSLRNPVDLELALQYCQESLAMEASGVNLLPRWELLLALGDIIKDTDFDGAIAALRESKQLCPQDEPQRYMVLYRLSTSLSKRNIAHERQYVEDAEEALALEAEALRLGSNIEDGIDKCEILINRLRQEYAGLQKHASNPNEFLPSITKATDALKMAENSPTRHIALRMLGMLYYEKFLLSEDPQDIAHAYRYFSEALKVIASGLGFHNRANILAWLARVHLQRGTEFFDIAKAYELLDSCLDDTHCSAIDRLLYVGDCIHHAFAGRRTKDPNSIFDYQPSKLADIFIKALRLFPEITALEVDFKTSLESLRKWGVYISHASRLCSDSERIIDGVRTLEEGRAIFWSQVFRTRATAPPGIPLELSKRLQSLSQQVEHIRFYETQPSLHPFPTLEYSRRKRIGAEYDALIKEIRGLPNAADFLSVPLDDVLEASEHGPVIMLLSHIPGSVAYMLYRKVAIYPDSFVLGHLKLERLKQSVLQDYIAQLNRANSHVRGEVDRSLGLTTDGEEGHDSGASPSRDGERAVRKRAKAVDAFTAVLKSLWDILVKPILDSLNIKPSLGRDRPRVWWCLAGDFAFLPIHAAGDYSTGGECCSDYIVSSYTPTITALSAARKAYKPIRKTDIKALLAAVPHPFQGSPLQETIKELQQVAKVIPQSQRIPLPPSDDALLDAHAGLSVPTAIAKLPDASILHLACHGVQDFYNPLNSGFLLRDAKLSIEQLMPIPLPHAFLAFLSACETAKGDPEYGDQVIHLASTMLFAGFKSVVGTMWSMSDIDGPSVAGHVYSQIFSGEGEYLDPNVVPYALDEIVQQLRANRVPPSRWATFIHLGM